MELRTLGATGMRVSPLCLGSMMFGAIGNRDHDECVRIIHRAIDAGINFIDTADTYSRGESETIVGKAIKGRRDSLIIATKFFNPMGDDPNMRGGSRRWVTRAVEDSLRRLGTDYIDLYQIHRYDVTVDIEEVLFSLTELVRQGKIRQFGSSMFSADRIVESHWAAQRMGTLRFRCEQPVYSIFARDIERFVLPTCQRYGMGVITWSPLDGGFLSGKYRKPEDLTGDNRIAFFSRRIFGDFNPQEWWIRRKLEAVGELIKLAQEINVTLPQMAIAFAIEHPGVTSAIIGPRTMDQLEGILAGATLKLSTDTLDKIDAIAPPGTTLNPLIDVPSGTSKHLLRKN
jgi:aryl-alcohol dehydrogenase-like predicted oxidoreductase